MEEHGKYAPCQTTKANLTRSLYSSLPNFIRTYAYAASSSSRLSVISAISPVPVAASFRLSEVAEAYCQNTLALRVEPGLTKSRLGLVIESRDERHMALES
jgi:hypothetical protein